MKVTKTRTLGLALSIVAIALAAGLRTGAETEGSPHGAYVEDCSLCHGGEKWLPVTIGPKFEHAKYGFALTSAHRSVACRACHKSLEFKKTGTNCVDCHMDVHLGEFGLDCAVCHTTRNFIERASQVRRHQLTRFPLQGTHASIDCVSCHKPAPQGQAMFVNTPTECEACHIDDYIKAKKPNHVASNFSHDCSQCHLTTTWQAASFFHDATGFPLTGAHRSLACSACHQSQGTTPTTCDVCHQTNYAQTSNPPHTAAGFSTDCAQCHSTRAWIPSRWKHDDTGFSLTGAHKSLACAACHPNNQYQGTPTTCEICHQTNYAQTSNPPHAAAGFLAADCTGCHSTKAWVPSTWKHDVTGFTLTGAHITAACSACHVNNQYQGTPTDCYACHQTDYANTTNPNHAAAGFGTDCATCHGTNAWQGGQFNHDGRWFPINSGTHRGRWNACADCHINPSNYADFSCLGCHPHSDKARTDAAHSGEGGYRYDSQACYHCHPDGRAGD